MNMVFYILSNKWYKLLQKYRIFSLINCKNLQNTKISPNILIKILSNRVIMSYMKFLKHSMSFLFSLSKS